MPNLAIKMQESLFFFESMLPLVTPLLFVIEWIRGWPQVSAGYRLAVWLLLRHPKWHGWHWVCRGALFLGLMSFFIDLWLRWGRGWPLPLSPPLPWAISLSALCHRRSSLRPHTEWLPFLFQALWSLAILAPSWRVMICAVLFTWWVIQFPHLLFRPRGWWPEYLWIAAELGSMIK